MRSTLFLIAALAVTLEAQSVRAGVVDEKWSGQIKLQQDFFWNVYDVLNDGQWHMQDGQRISEWQRIEHSLWAVQGERTISISVNDGNYNASLLGNVHVLSEYLMTQHIFQPITSHIECGWNLFANAEPLLDNPAAANLSIDVSCDNNYSISIGDLAGYDMGGFSLHENSVTPELCDFKGIDKELKSVDLAEFTDPPVTIEQMTSDRDHLEGNQDAWQVDSGPSWYSEFATAIHQVAPPQVKLPDPGKVAYYNGVSWDLQRPAGHWAGTVTMTLYSAFKTATNWVREVEDPCYSNEPRGRTEDYLHTNLFVCTFPDDGGTGTAQGKFRSHYTTVETTDGSRNCSCYTPDPPAWRDYHTERTSTSETDAEGSESCGALKVTSIPAPGLVAVSFPPISMTMSGTQDNMDAFLATGGCDPPISTTQQKQTHVDELETGGPSAFLADVNPADCDHLQGSHKYDTSSSPDRPFYWIVTWDLHFRHARSGGNDLARNNSQTSVRPLPIIGGAVQCSFTNKNSSRRTIPQGMEQAGSTFHRDSTFTYEAAISYVTNSTFKAAITAEETSSNQISSIQTMVCRDFDGVTQTIITNDLPTTVEQTLVASLNKAVLVTISATTDRSQYWVHIEIPKASGGDEQIVSHATSHGGCADFPPIADATFTRTNWSAGSRILDFHGDINTSDPQTLAGEAAFDNGSIQWNLKTDVSTLLFLTPNPTADKQGLILSWESGSGIYLQETASLASPVWHDVADSVNTNTLTRPFGAGAAFFRLIQR